MKIDNDDDDNWIMDEKGYKSESKYVSNEHNQDQQATRLRVNQDNQVVEKYSNYCFCLFNIHSNTPER